MARLPPPIYNDITQIIGNTPIVRLNPKKFSVNNNTALQEEGARSHGNVEYLVKLEYTNGLSGSIKDRVAKKILADAERSNKIKPGTTLLIPSSGNLGLQCFKWVRRDVIIVTVNTYLLTHFNSLYSHLFRCYNIFVAISIALLARQRGYKTIALVPERTTIDRIQVLKSLGVEIIRTPNEARPGHSESNFDLAIKLSTEIANSVVIDEFTNQSNIQEHYEETAQEIYTQVEGKLDVLVVGVESGGSITGIAKSLKVNIPGLKVIAVEPQHSKIREDEAGGSSFIRKDRKVEDIGNNFIPPIIDFTLIDEWIKISDRDSYIMAKKLISEGFLAGPSSGSV
ncbi:14401_t:CDS:2, partial [Acaulospora morrowiae]